MTMIEIILLLVGCVFMIGSFFISEKLSSSELNKIAELSEDELKKIIEREVNNAGTQMDEVIEQKIEEAGEQAERAMEKESNEQIMQIHEYSETVMESMKKTHDEIMFLYSMLNDKHTEMTSMTGDLQRLAADIRNLQEKSVRESRHFNQETSCRIPCCATTCNEAECSCTTDDRDDRCAAGT